MLFAAAYEAEVDVQLHAAGGDYHDHAYGQCLQEQLGECASADGPHGADHAPLVLFGERAAYFSITGVIRRLHARPWRAVRSVSG